MNLPSRDEVRTMVRSGERGLKEERLKVGFGPALLVQHERS